MLTISLICVVLIGALLVVNKFIEVRKTHEFIKYSNTPSVPKGEFRVGK